jgi:hypothetical protein
MLAVVVDLTTIQIQARAVQVAAVQVQAKTELQQREQLISAVVVVESGTHLLQLEAVALASLFLNTSTLLTLQSQD